MYCEIRTDKHNVETREVIAQLGRLLLESKCFLLRKSLRLACLSITFIINKYKKMHPINIKTTQSLFSGILIWFVNNWFNGNGLYFLQNYIILYKIKKGK